MQPTNPKEAARLAAQEAEEKRMREERHRRATDTNYNPLLQNGVTNKDVSGSISSPPPARTPAYRLSADFQNAAVPLRDRQLRAD